MPRIKKDTYTFKTDYPVKNVKAGDKCKLIDQPFCYNNHIKNMVNVKLLNSGRTITCFAWRIGL